MLTASLIGTALGITIVLGAGITAYLWIVRQPKLLVGRGVTSLASMRWREYADFVVGALRAQGFDHDPSAARPQRGQPADLVLSRDDQAWLVGCKQNLGEVITATQVADLAHSVRDTGAGGGILATLGQVDADAKGTPGIELLDGPTVWSLVEPLLPQSLRLDLQQRARGQTLRDIQLSWLVALLGGFALAMLLPSPAVPDPAPASVTAVSRATADTVAPAAPPANAAVADPLAVAPGSEEQRREAAMREISALPGVEEASWATRSTLVVYLTDDDASAEDVALLCATIERYDELRASRLQLQARAGSETPVRFKQCHAY
ncbi:MAG TPA: restriction endonuclease [Lysobacter sp.]|nr:restriction endonuclease [Lysobacter sp.]